MTQPPDDESRRQRPSWYTDGPGEQTGVQGPGRAAGYGTPPTGSGPNDSAPEQFQQPPSAAAAGGYGISQAGVPPAGYAPIGYKPTGYGYYGQPGQSPPAGYPGYSATPGTDELNQMHSWQDQQAQSAATAALVLGIAGFFTVPFIMGPLAIWQASRARRLGHDASAGRVLGWICTVWGIAIIALPFLLVILTLFTAAM